MDRGVALRGYPEIHGIVRRRGQRAKGKGSKNEERRTSSIFPEISRLTSSALCPFPLVSCVFFPDSPQVERTHALSRSPTPMPAPIVAIALTLACLAPDEDVPSFARDLPVVRTGDAALTFNGKDLTGFYTYTKDHKYDDPNQVVSVKDGMVRISGEEFGGLATCGNFGNYHLIAEWKWGEKTWGRARTRRRTRASCFTASGPTARRGASGWSRSSARSSRGAAATSSASAASASRAHLRDAGPPRPSALLPAGRQRRGPPQIAARAAYADVYKPPDAPAAAVPADAIRSRRSACASARFSRSHRSR